MAYSNYAAGGATQNNFGFQINRTHQTYHYYLNILPSSATVAISQKSSSFLNIPNPYHPLQEPIRVTSDGHIIARHHHGEGIYDWLKGKITSRMDNIEEMIKQDIEKNGERPTHLGTLIICLSVALCASSLCQVLVKAIVRKEHGRLDDSTTDNTIMLQGLFGTYADAVLSHDGMCNTLETAKARVRNIVEDKAPHIDSHGLFLKSRLPSEQTDFVEFITGLWSARADGGRIYIRSVKLLSLALLLSEYGCQIDVFVEGDDLETIPIKAETSALRVVYRPSSIKYKGREYVAVHLANDDPSS
ncbi:hypothetical protein F5X99DRAFT_401350 [Biscogniauxia marginata]|nr:hypothetical protein F5X99DRAFT_401350 [Biscogniauxia marginata]